MKTINDFVIRFTLISTLFITAISCKNDTFENDNSSRVIPETQEITVTEYGARCHIEYSIENPISSSPLSVKSSEPWVVDIDTSTSGTVSFTVLCNDSSEPREAILTLRYPSQKHHPEVAIKQAACADEKLSLELKNVDYSECSVDVIPATNDITYIVMIAERDYFATNEITNAEELVYANEIYFRGYMAAEEDLEEFLVRSNFGRCGGCTQGWRDLSPAKEYIIYTYGVAVIDNTLHRTTPVYYLSIESRLPERHSTAFTVTAVSDGPEVSVKVEPHDWQGYYMVQFVADTEAGYITEGEEFTEDNEEALAESFFYIADHLFYFEQLSAEEVMQELGYKGAVDIAKTLDANHKYMILVYAIDSIDGNVPMVVSHPTVEYLATGNVAGVDMTFDVQITNIRPRSVDISITPSADYPYTAVMMYASNLPEGTPEEQLAFIMEKYPPLELTGHYEEHIDQLPPSTEFVLAVYGYYAGAATTPLYTYHFTTKDDGVGGNTISEVRCSAYDIREVVALEPYYSSYVGYADYFLSVEVITAESSPTLHFDIIPSSMLEEYGLEYIRESLLEYSYTSSPDWTLCTYGNEYVVCGMAEDESGYVGELYVSEPISFTYEQRSGAQEFVDTYKDYTN